jgi:mycofactocin radical SAM maturase
VTSTLPGRLVDQFELGLDAPICLTWELTYACNLSCVHCLSSSGRRDPRELSTEQCKAVIDELEAMQVFYVNIGGGEPTVRADFWELVDYATQHHVGVKFSTNGVRIDEAAAARLAASDYVDVQISLDGATAEVNDAVRGGGSFAMAIRALENLSAAGFRDAKISVVMTRHNVGQLDDFKALADTYGATLRITRLRPSGRGADVWDELHPTAAQQRDLYDWLVAHGDGVLTGDSFFHLSAYGEPLPGLNLCGAGRVVCLIDPVGDVYACPFAIHEQFLAGNILRDRGFASVWRDSELFAQLRSPQTGGACAKCSHFDSCRGGCMAAKFFTGLPLDGPDPECVRGYGESALAQQREIPKPAVDHSRSLPLTPITRRPKRACDVNPVRELL